MALKAGIVGLPNVGKSTLFNCLSSAKAQAANFPFCTIDAQMGQITVPDERLNKLAELVHPGRIVPATCDIVDIAGLVKGASKGEGLGNQFLGNIRETDAIIHVLRCFDNDNIVHVDGSVDPVRDKEIIDIELQLKDLETVENRIKRVEKQARVGGDKMAKLEYDVLMQYKAALEAGKSARTVTFETDDEQQIAKNLFLLTAKPVLYVCNVDDTSAATGNKYVEAVREAIKDASPDCRRPRELPVPETACRSGKNSPAPLPQAWGAGSSGPASFQAKPHGPAGSPVPVRERYEFPISSSYISSRISSANSSRSSGTPCFRMPHLGQDRTVISFRSFFRNCSWNRHSTMLSQIFLGVGGALT